MMNGHGKSDRPVVPAKSPNNTGQPVAEGMEVRGLAKGNPPRQNKSRTPSRTKGTNMENPTRARSGKPRTQPRGRTYVHSYDLPSALERITSNGAVTGRPRRPW